MIRALLFIPILAFTIHSVGQTVLFEEGFSSGIPSTWTIVDGDGNIPASSVEEFTAAWIPYISGTDTAAASTSFYTPSGQSDDYLITPALTIGNFSKLVWSARSVDVSFPDGYVVLVSSTDNLPSSFTDTIFSISEENGLLQTRSIDLDVEGYSNQSIYIAFKNATTDGFVLLLDEVQLLGAETAGIDNIKDEITTNIKISPNPTSNFIHVNTPDLIIETVVYSLEGRIVGRFKTKDIQVSNLETGTYIAVVQTEKGKTPLKFVKK